MAMTDSDKSLVVVKNTFINPFHPPAREFDEVARSFLGAVAKLNLAKPCAHLTLYTFRLGFLRRPSETFLLLCLFARRTPCITDESGRTMRITPKVLYRRLLAFVADRIKRKSLLRSYEHEVAAALRS